MNQKRRFKLATLFMGALSLLAFTSCSGSDDPVPSSEGNLTVKEVTLSRKTDYGNDWIYYSLSQGKEVIVSEESHQTDLTWDLAFNRYNVRTNSGASGNGKGGALDTEKTSMDAVTSVPNDNFTVDTKGEITGSFTGSGITNVESTLNASLCKAIEFAGPPPTYTPNNHVYIVKTADGKYAKVKIDGFYNDEGVSGYVTFSYVYQSDGTQNLGSK